MCPSVMSALLQVAPQEKSDRQLLIQIYSVLHVDSLRINHLHTDHISNNTTSNKRMCVSALCVIHTRHLPSAVANSSPILFVCNIHCAVLFMTVGVESACLLGDTRKKALHTHDQGCFDVNWCI